MNTKDNPCDTAVLVPVFNEKDAVADVLEALVPATDSLGLELIVVDDGSTDGSADIIDGFSSRAKVLHHTSNHGYGAALKTGIRSTRARNIVFFDSDGQHGVPDLATIVDLLNDYEFVFGKRERGAGSPLIRQPGIHRVNLCGT